MAKEEENEEKKGDKSTDSVAAPVVATRSSGRTRNKPKEYSPSGEDVAAPVPTSVPASTSIPQKEPPRSASPSPLPPRQRQKIVKRFSPTPAPKKSTILSMQRNVAAKDTESAKITDTIVLNEFKKTFYEDDVIPPKDYVLSYKEVDGEEVDIELEEIDETDSAEPEDEHRTGDVRQSAGRDAALHNNDDNNDTPVQDDTIDSTTSKSTAKNEASTSASGRPVRKSAGGVLQLTAKLRGKSLITPSASQAAAVGNKKRVSIEFNDNVDTADQQVQGGGDSEDVAPPPTKKKRTSQGAELATAIAEIPAKKTRKRGVTVGTKAAKQDDEKKEGGSGDKKNQAKNTKRRGSTVGADITKKPSTSMMGEETNAEAERNVEEEAKSVVGGDVAAEQKEQALQEKPKRTRGKTVKTAQPTPVVAEPPVAPPKKVRGRTVRPPTAQTPTPATDERPSSSASDATDATKKRRGRTVKTSTDIAAATHDDPVASTSITKPTTQTRKRGRTVTSTNTEATRPGPLMETASRPPSSASNASSGTTEKVIRRSGRQTAPTVKAKELKEQKNVSASNPVIKIKPGSALAIKKAVGQFRKNRSPTPELATSSPITPRSTPTEKQKDRENEQHDKTAAVLEKPSQHREQSAVELDKEKEVGQPGVDVTTEQPVEENQSQVVEDNSNTEHANEEANIDTKDETLTEESSKDSNAKSIVESDEQVVSKAKDPEYVPETPTSVTKKTKTRGKTVTTASITPKSTEPVPVPSRRSGRAFKPKRFDDFVGPETVLKIPDSVPEIKITSKKRETFSPATTIPIEDSAAEKTRKHVKENKPLKVLLKIAGSEVSSRMLVGADEEGQAPLDETTEEEVLTEEIDEEDVADTSVTIGSPFSSSKKDSKKKQPSWWTNYTPSPKPILENIIRPDGSVEKVGVTVNAVMDKILLLVCQDGITRNSNARSKQAKKDQLMSLSKQRYQDKRKNVEELKAEALAHGKMFVEPAHPAKKTTSELYAHTIATRDRTKKAGIYRQNEYLQKPVKHHRTAEEKKADEEQKIRSNIDKIFQRGVEEDMRKGSQNFYKPKKREKIGIQFSSYVDTHVPHAREQLLPTVKNPDLYHRELLKQEADSDECITVADEEIDVLSGAEAPPLPEPIPFDQDAANVANKIGALLLRPTKHDGTFDVSDMYMRIQEEPLERRALYDCVVNEIVEFYGTQATCFGQTAGLVEHNEAYAHSLAIQEHFTRFTEDVSFWVHHFLVEYLPLGYLTSYLIILRYLRSSYSTQFASTIVNSTAEEFYPWPDVTKIIWKYVDDKTPDPSRDPIHMTSNADIPQDVYFVLIHPNITYDDHLLKEKSADLLFRWINSLGRDRSIRMDLDFSDTDDSLASTVDIMVKYVKEKIQKMVKERRDKRIVLVGWGITCFINHRVVSLTHGVSALIDLAFPLKTRYGYRGNADDDILLTYCPSLFVVGAASESFNPYALKELRSSMLTESGVVVIHNANEDLAVTREALNSIGITQRALFRAILECILEFLHLEATKKERSQLIPHDLRSVYELDTEAMKTIVSNNQALKGRQQAEAKAPQEKVSKPRKRKAPEPSSVAPLPPQMPALLAESSVSTNEARSRFDEIVKRAQESRRPEDFMATSSVAFNRPLPKASPLPSPSLPRPAPRPPPSAGLINPANISLN